MTNTKYNGWTNYETWRVNLEIFDCMTAQDFDGADAAEPDVYEISLQLKDYAEDAVFLDCRLDERRPTSLMEDYARAFLQNVNWREIAQHMIDDYIAENQE